MRPKRIISHEFESIFNGNIILDYDIEQKLNNKHKVYKEDLLDVISDPYLIVMRATQKSPINTSRITSSGIVYEILCESESNRVMFVVGRLFKDGNLFIITAYWANNSLAAFYYQESEALRNE
ncbi:hypothetical protein [Candidatus Formimonas warabiya]|nr:hypothetical protein [Candidatus Formimonas warabiya]